MKSKYSREIHQRTQCFLLPLRVLHERAASYVEGGVAVLRQAGAARSGRRELGDHRRRSPCREAVQQLWDAGILQTLTPADVLAKYSGPVTDAIRRICTTGNSCDAWGGGRWTLSLTKVPQDLQIYQIIRRLMDGFAWEVWSAADRLSDRRKVCYEFAATGQSHDEYREGYGADVEYRFADVPLALGEAIMMNQALFTGLHHADATPITDDSFHSRALSLKLRLVDE